MVFYDRFGIRKHYIWGSALLALFLCAGITVTALIAVTATAHETLAYTNHEEDATFDKTIALTFDDGPTPQHTRAVMTLLKEEDVPATFFLIGENVILYPDIAREIVDTGFEIGNHTFTHSEHMADSELRLRRELIATERVIREATGRTTHLFRPPFLEDVDVGEFDGGRIGSPEVRWAENAGFVVVGANLDTRDWNVEPGRADVILSRLRERMPESGPTVIIMHEGAANGASIEALRTFIPEMKARGYRFVPTSEYFGLSKADAMPVGSPLTALDSILVSAAKTYVLSRHSFTWFILFISILGIARLVGLLSTRRLLGSRPVRTPTHRSPVSVIIPAYNEEANIEATVRSVWRSLTHRDEIIVINDGSTDATEQVVESLRASLGHRLVLLKKENGGTKGSALVYGLAVARHEILICMDADTIVDTHAVDRLAVHFNDPKVGAVAGKVYPALVGSVLSIYQYLEYVIGQNIEKEVFARAGAVGVVPGALGAWRASAVRDAGGYSPDTVVEDQDLTLALLSRSWKVHFEPYAFAFTETPANFAHFFRQRSRWVYGTMQCVWKYRHMLGSRTHPALGWLILPNVLVFNLLIPLLIPFADIAILSSILSGEATWSIIGPFLVFTLLDMWAALEGLRYEEHIEFRFIPLVVWQRVFYRYMMAAAIVQSVGIALAGTVMRWGSHERRGECHPALNNITPEQLTPSPIQIATPITSGS